MEMSTSTLIGLIVVPIIMAALIWVLVRALPRTRGLLRTETTRLDEPSRRSAAALLAGWGSAGGWALAAGVGTYVVLRVVSTLWIMRVVDAVLTPLSEASDLHFQSLLACQQLTAPDPEAAGAEEVAQAAIDKCVAELGEAPALSAYDDAMPMLLGVLAPILAALVALGVLAWMVARRRITDAAGGAAISAGLRPRGVLSFGPRWALAIPALTALVLCGWLLVTGLLSSRDEFGRFTMLTVVRHTAAQDPEGGYLPPLTPHLQSVTFPGWFTAVPVITVALLLLVIFALLLRGLAQAPRPTDHRVTGVDDIARMLKAKLVAGLTGAGLLAALGSVAMATGGALLTVGHELHMVGDRVESFEHEAALSGLFMYIGGLVFNGLAILMMMLAFGAVVELSAARRLAVAVALGEEPETEQGKARQSK